MHETIPSDFSFRLNFFHLKTKKEKSFFAFRSLIRNFGFAEFTSVRKSIVKKNFFSFAFRSLIRNFAEIFRRSYSVSAKKETSFFVLHSTFSNFAPWKR